MDPRGGTIDWKGVSAIKGLSAFCRETIRDRLRANHHHLLDLLLAGSSPLFSLSYSSLYPGSYLSLLLIVFSWLPASSCPSAIGRISSTVMSL